MSSRKSKQKPRRFPQLVVARSRIHGLGLFAGEDIEWGRPLIEYRGELLSEKEVLRRQRFYDRVGFTCLMQFSDGRGIDGITGDNESRFINHSQKANVAAFRKGENRIIFYSLDDIASGEELTFNYGFNPAKREGPGRIVRVSSDNQSKAQRARKAHSSKEK